MTFWQKLGTINKATISVVCVAVIWAVDKYAGLGWDADERAIVEAAIIGVAVWAIANKEKVK